MIVEIFFFSIPLIFLRHNNTVICIFQAYNVFLDPRLPDTVTYRPDYTFILPDVNLYDVQRLALPWRGFGCCDWLLSLRLEEIRRSRRNRTLSLART